MAKPSITQYALLCLALAAISAPPVCRGQLDASRLDREARHQGSPTQLRGTTLVAEGLPRIAKMRAVGRRLVLANFPPSPPIEVRDRATGRLLRQIGEWGQGEGQFMSAYHLDPLPEREECWVYDVTRHRLALIDLTDAGLRSREPVRQRLTLRTDAVLTGPTWVGDSLITPGFFYGGRFAVLTNAGQFAHFAGSALAKPGEPVVVTQTAYQSVVQPDPGRTRLVLAASWAGKLEIFRTDGSKLADGAVPDAFEPLYQVVRPSGGEPRVVHPDEARNGYTDLAVGDVIYALFSGRTKGETEATFYPAGRDLQVFAWDGRHLADYRFEKDAALITLDAASRQLYVFHPTPRPEIAVYVLPRTPVLPRPERPPSQ